MFACRMDSRRNLNMALADTDCQKSSRHLFGLSVSDRLPPGAAPVDQRSIVSLASAWLCARITVSWPWRKSSQEIM